MGQPRTRYPGAAKNPAQAGIQKNRDPFALNRGSTIPERSKKDDLEPLSGMSERNHNALLASRIQP